MTLKRKSLLALLGSSLFVLAAQAGEEARGCPAQFSEFDLDGDGAIVEQEWLDGHAERMKAMAEEGRKMKHAGEMPTFASIDLDGNGQVDEAEFEAHKKAHMHKHMGEDKHQGGHESAHGGEHKHEHKHGQKQQDKDEG